MNKFKLLSKNKYFLSITSVILLIIITGLIGNNLIQSTIKNWPRESSKIISQVEEKAQSILKLKQEKLISVKDILKKNLYHFDFNEPSELEEFIKEYSDQSLAVSIFNENQLLAWNENFRIELVDSGDQSKLYNYTFFKDAGITKYICVYDTFQNNSIQYEFLLAEIIEKDYRLNEDYYSEISLTKEIEKSTGLDFSINYNLEAIPTKDGRKHSFELLNNINKKIGIATFLKPSRENAVKDISRKISNIQSILLLIGFLMLGFALYKSIKDNSKHILKLLFLSFYLIVLRYLLIYLDIFRSLFESKFLTHEIYYSDFGYGLAYSIVDLLVTLIFAVIISRYLFIYSLAYSRNSIIKKPNKFISVFVSLLLLAVYLLALRGFGAVIRGFVFDTTLSYFETTSLNLSFPHILMHLNALFAGIISIFISASIILLILKINRVESNKFDLKNILILIISFSFLIIVFDKIQHTPQLTIAIKILHFLFTFLVVYLFTNLKFSRILLISVIFILSSIISISALLYYNSKLEKSSLKRTAYQIIRVDDNWYKSIIYETLLSDFSREEAEKAFVTEGNNFNSSAYKIWSKSKLQSESINSSVNFIGLSGELLGGFGSIYPGLSLDNFIDTNSVIEEIQIFEESLNGESQKLLRGIFPIKNEFAFLGYLDVSILSDMNDFGFSTHPDFISSGKLNTKSVLKLEKLLILDYRNDQLKVVYGDMTPNQNISEAILNCNFTDQNDAWISLKEKNSDYIWYVKRAVTDGTSRIVAVGLRGKELSISLFDFFKVFFTHVIILLIFVLGYLLVNFKRVGEIKYDLRTKLLTAFLVISIIPLLLTAYYFRNLTKDKNADAIYYKLGKRAFSIENYLNNNLNNIELTDLFIKASFDLNINFTIYKQYLFEFSSQDLIYDVGLMSKVIPPKVYNDILLGGSQEVLISESVDKYKFNSFYYKANIGGQEYIIKVSDVFNSIRLPLSGSEVDVFLFGFYFLAAILIIIFSLIFANQISLPIRKLTLATRSVAAGDFNFEIDTNAKGELGELVSGFKFMIKEIKKNQSILAEIEREEAWKEMAKQVAHEIKNPLTPMKLSVQQLIAAYNDKSDKFENYFNKVTITLLNQIETLKNIATEFSNFARMPKLKLEKIDSMKILKQAMDLFVDEKIEIAIVNKISDSIILGDSEQLMRTFINIIRNAIQAEATKINFNIIDNNGELIMEVIDDGLGISEENYEKIFEVNFTTKTEGMGLGLSMARRYLRSTGGDIKVERTITKGAKFILIFPR